MSGKPRHYLGLEGANVIQTDALSNAIDLLKMVMKYNAIGVVLGGPGTGKTFSLETALSLIPGVDFIWITFPTDTTARLVSQRIVEALTASPAEKIERNEVLRSKAQKLLLKRKCLVVCDEAQHLHRTGIEALRYLHDACGCSFPIVLSGGHGCWDVLSKQRMLRSRIFDSVVLAPLTEEDLLEVLPSYHQIYVGVDPDVICLVNDRYGQGIFRHWAAFTLKAVDRLEGTNKKLTKKFASSILKTFPDDELADGA